MAAWKANVSATLGHILRSSVSRVKEDFNLGQAPAWTAGFEGVSQIKVGAENCICGGRAPKPGEGSVFPSLQGCPGRWEHTWLVIFTSQSQDSVCFGEKEILN